jgi:hypothetical protein
MPLNLKSVVIQGKDETQMHSRVWIMHSILTTCTKESQSFQDLGVIHNDNRLKDMIYG